MEKEDVRKGPWSEQEDVQLVFYVKLFGDRQWDFIAKVSGLKRTGKSCRLHWVNYLHPGLKREKLTPNEERLVVELQSKWGNRWSKIARKLPGRTDNEIKNYWRTHMRKTKKNKGSSSPSSSYSSSSASSSKSSAPTKEQSFFDTGGADQSSLGDKTGLEVEQGSKVYTMDEIWKEFEFSEENRRLTSQTVASPVWDDYSTDSLWCMNTEEERKMLMQQPMGDFCNYMIGQL